MSAGAGGKCGISEAVLGACWASIVPGGGWRFMGGRTGLLDPDEFGGGSCPVKLQVYDQSIDRACCNSLS